MVIVGADVVFAGTPFGGDDTGSFVPPNKTVAKCENKIAKGVGKLVAGLLKCHAGRVSGKITNEAGEDSCETTAKTTFTTKADPTNCPCINPTDLADRQETHHVDPDNNLIYCAAGTAWGGDDTGNIPADAPKGPVAKCENGVGKAVGKLVAGLLKCHAQRATGKFTDDAGEDTCEATAIAKFTSKTKTTGCDPCTNLANLGSFVEGKIDGDHRIYCESPSGAFLE